jgi:hypothetical protein
MDGRDPFEEIPMPSLKGAFLKFKGGLLGLPDIVVFQFNPETVSRTPSLSLNPPSEQTNPNRLIAAPTESYSFSLRLDATDQLAAKNPIAISSGILPALSALELLMYPVPATGGELPIPNSGAAYTYPPESLPVVLFFWGPFRILPVNVTSMSINEMEYDPLLNPTRAEVTVNLQVVSPPALDRTDDKLMQGAYKYTQTVKEVMSALNLANSAELVGSMMLSL